MAIEDYQRPQGTVRHGSRRAYDAADAYRQEHGNNPRTEGSFTRGEGESMGDFIRRRNQSIGRWDRGFNTAVHGSAGDYSGEGAGPGDGPDRGGGPSPWQGLGGGGGAPGGPGAPLTMAQRVQQFLEQQLSGQGGAFGADAVRQAKANQFELLQNRLGADQRATTQDAISRGMEAGPGLQASLNQNRRGLSEQYAGASRQIESDMRMQQYQAQSDAMQAYLEQSRAEAEQAISRERNSIERERIAADQRIAERQIQARMDEIHEQMAGEQASGRANRDWQEQQALQNRQWELEDWARNQPFNIGAQFGG